MTIFREWHDVVIYPANPSLVWSREERFATDPLAAGGVVVRREHFVGADEVFEAMEVTERGGVAVWTSRRVWYLQQDTGERFMFVFRHPTSLDDHFAREKALRKPIQL